MTHSLTGHARSMYLFGLSQRDPCEACQIQNLIGRILDLLGLHAEWSYMQNVSTGKGCSYMQNVSTGKGPEHLRDLLQIVQNRLCSWLEGYCCQILTAFYYFSIILRGPSGIHQNCFFLQFPMDPGFYRLCRAGPMQGMLPYSSSKQGSFTPHRKITTVCT